MACGADAGAAIVAVVLTQGQALAQVKAPTDGQTLKQRLQATASSSRLGSEGRRGEIADQLGHALDVLALRPQGVDQGAGHDDAIGRIR